VSDLQDLGHVPSYAITHPETDDIMILLYSVGSSQIVEQEVMATYETIRGLEGLFPNLIISLSVRYLFSSLVDRLPATHFIITIFIMVLCLLFILATSGSRF